METKIVRYDDLGRGICYVDGKVTFVPKTVVGDTILVKITKEKKNFNEGICQKIISPSPNRISPFCPYYDACGGCCLQNLSYEDTICYKKEKVINTFRKNHIDINPEFIKNPHPKNYRNKITLKVIDGKIGYYEEHSHCIIPIDYCLIAFPCLNKTISIIGKWGIKNGEVILRCNQNEEVLIIIETKDELNIQLDDVKSQIKLVGIVLNNETFYGENFLYEVINGLIYRISYNSFFQVNPYVASKLFQIVSDNVNGDDRVLELYSGVGTLSLSASRKAQSVVGIEIVANAVLNAIFNARINKITNAEFILNDATDAVSKLNVSFNKLIVDPPRSGLTKPVISMILNNKPQEIIYVSCNLATLVRDINCLNEQYEVKNIYILDMFSYTFHVECCLLLSLKNN